MVDPIPKFQQFFTDLGPHLDSRLNLSFNEFPCDFERIGSVLTVVKSRTMDCR